MRALFALLLLGFGSVTVHAMDRNAQLDDIREATFRHQFTDPDFMREVKVYFLELENGEKDQFHDPNPNFMKRFAGDKPRVAVVSAAHVDMEDVHDLKTHEKGVLLIVTGIHWISDNEVEVTGGSTGFGYGGYTYDLKKRNGKWTVVKSTQTSMS